MQCALLWYVLYVSMMFTLCICVANVVLYLAGLGWIAIPISSLTRCLAACTQAVIILRSTSYIAIELKCSAFEVVRNSIKSMCLSYSAFAVLCLFVFSFLEQEKHFKFQSYGGAWHRATLGSVNSFKIIQGISQVWENSQT